jgi:hypothetical protein
LDGLLQEAAQAAAGLEVAQTQVQQHQEAIVEARRLQRDASACLVSLSLRCECLAETLASEKAAREVSTATERGSVAGCMVHLIDVPGCWI